MDEEPLIYTSKGNVPISSLVYRQGWTNLGDGALVFWEEHLLDDEIVKRSAHVYDPRIGVVAQSLVSSVGG